MPGSIISNTPFASQMEDIKKYVDEFRKSKNNSTHRYNHNLRNIGNASTYGNSNQPHFNKSNGSYHYPAHPYQNVNVRRDNSSNSSGTHNNNYNNGYFNSKQKRNNYNSANDFNTNSDNTYKGYNNIPNYNSNNFGRSQQNYTSYNNDNNAYNRNSNFTSHLRETYPQFYTDSNNHTTNSMFNNNMSFNNTNQQQQIDPHKSLMVTSLYNTYSQNSDLNNLNNFPNTVKYNSSVESSVNSGTPVLNSNESSFINTNNTSNTSLFNSFNTRHSTDSIQKSHSTSTNNNLSPSQTNLYRHSPYGNNTTFLNQLSPMPSNELKFNDNMATMPSNMISSHDNTTSNAFMNLSPSHDNYTTPNIAVNYMNTPTGTAIHGNSHNSRNMYLSQTTAPNYNGSGNGNSSFGSIDWNINNVNKNGIAGQSNISIPSNNNSAISSSTMNKSFGIWN